MKQLSWTIALALLASAHDLQAAKPEWHSLANPVVEGVWLRPAAEQRAKPVWGHADGLRIGLAPLPGPRGLLRVYTPYIGQPEWRMINFIAIEPILAGQTRRGYSELEPSLLAEGRGKAMWSVDRPGDWAPRDPTQPARGLIGMEDGVATLAVYVGLEKFRSGAAVYLCLRFRADRPHEVQIITYTQPNSKPLTACVITATMGNYARLRRLHLGDRTVHARDLYDGATFNAMGFAGHKRFDLDALPRTAEGAAIFVATSDERDPAATDHSGVGPGWRYVGRPATQYWRCDNPPQALMAQVNARRTYWASNTPIPGGVSFENMELLAPFQEGQSWVFGVTLDPPAVLLDAETGPNDRGRDAPSSADPR
jgi:hypothetical protein